MRVCILEEKKERTNCAEENLPMSVFLARVSECDRKIVLVLRITVDCVPWFSFAAYHLKHRSINEV